MIIDTSLSQFAVLLLTILIIQVAVAIYVFVTVKNAGDIKFKDAYANSLFFNYTKDGEERELVDTIQDGVRLFFRLYLIYLFIYNNILLHCYANITPILMEYYE